MKQEELEKKIENDMSIALKIIFGLSSALFLVSLVGIFWFNSGG